MRIHLAVALGVTALWQIYIVVVAFRMAPVLEGLPVGLGGELPAITRSFLGSYRAFGVLPAATAGAALVALRSESLRPWQSAVLVALALGATMALHAWTNEAFFAPVLRILRSID
jgi:hypothetical protein